MDEAEAGVRWTAAGVDVDMQAKLGRVVVNGGHMENLLGRLCEAIYSNDVTLSRENIWRGNAAKRRQLAEKLVRISGSFREDAAEAISTLLARSKDLAQERNDLFHGAIILRADGTYLLADSRGNKSRPITSEEIDRLGRDMHLAWDDLDHWVTELQVRAWYFDVTGHEL